ncbi:hypothetical protein RDWZM_002898 [Blomia tropicalis]|uniref:Uncharacterized protein n=1 Tax=Blomia tropicalis TaxID=40697 RepID=A0A9Q0MFT5_BLOTA|nr:hypothetical protein RDWZM_002898 [Blomia tropicalis]
MQFIAHLWPRLRQDTERHFTTDHIAGRATTPTKHCLFGRFLPYRNAHVSSEKVTGGIFVHRKCRINGSTDSLFSYPLGHTFMTLGKGTTRTRLV